MITPDTLRRDGWEAEGRAQARTSLSLSPTTSIAAAVALHQNTLSDYSPETARRYRMGCRAFMHFLADSGHDPTHIAVSGLPPAILESFKAWLVARHGREKVATIKGDLDGVVNLLTWAAEVHNTTPGGVQLMQVMAPLKRGRFRRTLTARTVDYAAVQTLALYMHDLIIPAPPHAGDDLPAFYRFARPLAPDEMRMRYRAALRDRALILTLYSTGIRRAEAQSLNRTQVSDGTRDEAIVRGKGEKERLIFFDAPAMAAIAHYGAARDDTDPALFIRHNTGGAGDLRLCKGTIIEVVHRWAAVAGVGVVRPHDFRHNLATTMLNRGAPLDVVQDILGHSSPAITKQIYAHYTHHTLKTLMARYRPSYGQLPVGA